MAPDPSGCCDGLAAACAWGGRWVVGLCHEQKGAVQATSRVRDNVRTRDDKGNTFVDIHTLLVRPDPARRLEKSYRILGPLGSGGFGSVFRAEYLPTGEERAVKVVEKPEDPERLDQALIEVEALVKLDHPNVEKFYEFFEDAKAICLVTELCTGGNLGALDRTEDSPEEMRQVLRDVVAAVAYCHNEGVVHRDIKFDNCLLTKRETARRRHAKVIDFGLSAMRPSSEQGSEWMDQAVGTIFFVAPEVVSKQSNLRKYGPNCDMWSIGVMMYMLLTDAHPFLRSPKESNATMLRVIHDDPVREAPMTEAGILSSTKDILHKLLEKDPAKRLSAAEALRHRFFTEHLGGDASPSKVKKVAAEDYRSIFGRICCFARFSRFERAVLTVVAHDASEDFRFQDLHQAFVGLDTARAGWLSRAGIKSALEHVGIELSAAELVTALEALDPDGDGKIQYTDWLAATIAPSALTEEKAMRKLFDFLDIYGKRKVTTANLLEALEVDASSADFPADFNKGVSCNEFQRIIRDVAAKLESEVNERGPVGKVRETPEQAWSVMRRLLHFRSREFS